MKCFACLKCKFAKFPALSISISETSRRKMSQLAFLMANDIVPKNFKTKKSLLANVMEF